MRRQPQEARIELGGMPSRRANSPPSLPQPSRGGSACRNAHALCPAAALSFLRATARRRRLHTSHNPISTTGGKTPLRTSHP